MLLGTTYAWFTDTVTSGTNRIQSGNLDVEMLYKNASTNEYTSVDKADVSDPVFFTDVNGNPISWEPGAMAYAYFKVKNTGTLSLKYGFYLNIIGKNALVTNGESHSLDEVIKAYFVKGDDCINSYNIGDYQFDDLKKFTGNGTLSANAEDVFTVILYWNPTVYDNLYNVYDNTTVSAVGENEDKNQLYINLDIRLSATQASDENDSFDESYDDNIQLWRLSQVVPDGRWISITDGEDVKLEDTTAPYITVVDENEQPVQIIPLTDGTFGVGNGTVIVNESNIEYSNYSGIPQKVVIRTDGVTTNLNIHAPDDVITHYGDAGVIKIDECAMNSFHEHGKVAMMEIAKGRIALEAGSRVKKLHLDSDGADHFDKIILAADPTVTLPRITRDTAEIGENGTLVVELQKDTNNTEETEREYFWLYREGVISQIVVTDNVIDGIAYDENDSSFHGYTDDGRTEEDLVLGVSEENISTRKVAMEIANEYTGKETDGTLVVDQKIIDLPKVDTDGYLADTDENNVTEKGLTEEEKNIEKQKAINDEISTDTDTIPECYVGTEAMTLADAVNNAPENENTVIILNKNIYIEGNDGITVPENKDITLDLNGWTITGVFGETSCGQLFDNHGKLTITDSSSNADGEITSASIITNEHGSTVTNADNGFSGTLILNHGDLTVEKGSIIQGIKDTLSYCVDNCSGARFTMNGGSLYNRNTYCIRMFCDSTTSDNNVEINGGHISGKGCIWVQNPYGSTDINNRIKNKGTLNISGGTLDCLANSTDAVYSYEAFYGFTGNDYGTYYDNSAISINISGGKINGAINVFKCIDDPTRNANCTITGGEINAPLQVYMNNKYVSPAHVGEDYIMTFTENMSGKTIHACYYGSANPEIIPEEYIDIQGMVVRIDAAAFHQFADNGTFCIFIYVD